VSWKIALENHRPGEIHRRIHGRGREVLRTAIGFLQVSRIIVAQAIVECQFAGDLPGVLRIHAGLILSDSSTDWVVNLYLVDLTEKETGISESRSLALKGRPVEVRKTGLVGREEVFP
jgi:hypothetical protein